jgi:hypothetical protein
MTELFTMQMIGPFKKNLESYPYSQRHSFSHYIMSLNIASTLDVLSLH